ncbi:MAG TPA: hypothetical protein VFL10_00940 [Ornithinibacter sp.]|nr:hypothetical protein [Ornithinibacter sp.]
MRLTARAAARAGLVGGAALLAAALTVTSAQAASADLTYSCDYGFDDAQGTATATASFDSAIGDDVVVEVGEGVSLDPFTGSVTLPDEFTALLRQNELSSIEGGGITFTLIDETGDEYDVFFDFGPEDVPGEGPMTLSLVGEGGDVTPKEAGTHTLVAGDFVLFVDTGETGPDVGMGCELTDEGDTTIDSFEAVAATSPTTAPSTSTDPVRPVVVQTDFAGEDRSTALPLVLGGGLLAVGTGAVATGRVRARAASRRH